MPKSTSTIFLALISLNSFAQKPRGSLEKLGLKNILSDISYIPAKSFTSLDYTGSDSVSFYGKRIATVHGFYISQTEVTNTEYREFVYYIKDSMAHALLMHFQGGTNSIDWSKTIDWKDDRLDALMLSPEDRIFGRKEIDPGKILYPIDFFEKKEIISIYPDTLVWLRDFTYAYNESLAKNYFSHSSYGNYPVVGINLKQAIAFCQWKTEQVSKSLKREAADSFKMVVRLPSNAEWESAAFEEKDTISLVSGSKQYNCNFGTITGRRGFEMKGFKDDGYFYTGPVKSFSAGPNELYDMKGNVSEWTSTARDEIMNVEVKPDKLKTSFIVKGGGWNSTAFYLQAGVCQFFSVDATHSFVGFRYVVYVARKE